MVTPHYLSCFNAKAALQTLLSPTERRRPWVLWTTPGLFVTLFLHNAITIVGLIPVRRVLIPIWGTGGKANAERLLAYLALVVFMLLIQVPLEVIQIRLSILRNNDPTSTNGESSVATPIISDELNAVWSATTTFRQ